MKKKKYLILVAFLISLVGLDVLQANSQTNTSSLVFELNNEVIEAGTYYVYDDVNDMNELAFEFTVTNASDSSKEIFCDKEVLYGNVGMSYYCWGQCLSPDIMSSSCNISGGKKELFSSHFTPIDENGELVLKSELRVKYSFYERGSSEKYDFIIQYKYLPNHWNANTSLYPNNMTVIGVISINDVIQENLEIEIGAFCGDEIRGSIKPKYENGLKDYRTYLLIYGNSNDNITFRLYDHNTEQEYDLLCENVIKFEVNATIGSVKNPYVFNFRKQISFIGEGEWNDASNWKNSALPEETDDVIIDGNAHISDEVKVNSLVINENKSLTIKDGGILTVTGNLTNRDVEALIIEEGGQIFQTNENVAATFRNEIIVPSGIWGEEDKTGWQFISSPIENVSTGDFIPTEGDYDLYMYDGTNEYQWQNFKMLGSKSYDFSVNPFNNGWTYLTNGDGNGWKYENRKKYVYSESYNEDDGDIMIDNYLITPQILINEGTELHFKAEATFGDEDFPETFKVLLSKTSNTNPNDFTYTLGDYSITNESTFTIDLSNYAGGNAYIAFYHYVEEYGSEKLIIDDVEFINDNNFEKGKGYLVSYQNESVANFKGNLNYLAEGESYQMNLRHYPDNILAQFNLVGNPFPFNINWETDIEVNCVYDGFATLNFKEGSYIYRENGTINAGEGFMIRTKESGSNYIKFTKGLSKSSRNENNSINIIASNSNGSDNVIIRFDDNEISGFPKLVNFNDKIANVYVKDENVNYGILNFNNDINEIPLYFDAKEMSNYTLTFDVKGIYENLYLLDKMTGEKFNLLLENEYSFIANSNDRNDRFILMKTDGQQPTTNSNFAYINNGELYIDAAGSIQIIDMMGRIVMTEEIHNGIINIGKLNGAAYIVRCINENEVKTQKIIVL